MITVACVLKSGGDFTPDYVTRLAAGVERNLTMDYDFVCLTDVEHLDIGGVLTIPLQQDWPGWWAKMELFRLPGPLMYLDLDMVLMNNLDILVSSIIKQNDLFVMLRGFYRQDRCSGILGWNGNMGRIFDRFYGEYANGASFKQKPNKTYTFAGEQHFRGDQEWLAHYLKNVDNGLSVTMAQDVMSGIYSYKVDVRQTGKVPEDAKIICFHGRPRPAELPANDELRKYWCNKTVPANS